MIWCNANCYLLWLWNLFLADHVVALSTKSLVSALALSLESCLFCLQPSHVSGCLSVLVSCCCSTWPDLMIIFHLVITLVDARRAWNLNKNLILSCLWQLSYVLLRCVLIFRSPPCWFLTLWLSLFAIPLLHNACSYNLIGATGNFTLGVCPVMVPWLAIYGAMTKPRASCGCTHKAVLLGTRWYRGF